MMTPERLAEIRRTDTMDALPGELLRQRNELLAEIDALTRERDECKAGWSQANDENARLAGDIAKLREVGEILSRAVWDVITEFDQGASYRDKIEPKLEQFDGVLAETAPATAVAQKQ